MPPKKRITEEILIEAAILIVKEQGIHAVTARTAAKQAGCSIQPVFACFGTMDEFKKCIFEYAMESFMQTTACFADSADYFSKLCSTILELASKEPNIYRLLFCESICEGKTASEIKCSFTLHRKYLDKMITMYGLNEKTCLEIIEKGIVCTYGISQLMASGNSFISTQKGISDIKMLTADLVAAAQRKRDNEKKRIVRKINDENSMSD